MGKMKYCPYCGGLIWIEETVCSKCGRPQPMPKPVQQPVQQPEVLDAPVQQPAEKKAEKPREKDPKRVVYAVVAVMLAVMILLVLGAVAVRYFDHLEKMEELTDKKDATMEMGVDFWRKSDIMIEAYLLEGVPFT